MTLSIAHLHPVNSESVVLALRATLDHRTTPYLQVAITNEAERQPRPHSIVVDLTGVERVDPAGVGSLVAGSRCCAVAGVGLTVRSTSPLIRALLQRAGKPQTDARGRKPTDRAHLATRHARLRPARARPAAPPQASARTRPRRGR